MELKIIDRGGESIDQPPEWAVKEATDRLLSLGRDSAYWSTVATLAWSIVGDQS